MDGYRKIKKEENQGEGGYYYYKNSSGSELYSGYTNPSMSYPVKIESGFHNFNENAQFYPLNDDITLVIEQDKRIGYVRRDSPNIFRSISGYLTQNIGNGYVYRVFFYPDGEFSIS